MIGRRKGYPGHPMPPHNLPMTMLGTGILWFGWAGFNAGSALAANGVAAAAIMNTFLAASAAMLGWLVVEKLQRRKAHDARCRVGCGRRARRDHTLRRVRRRHGSDLHRAIAGALCCLGVVAEEAREVRRQPRRRRRPPRGRARRARSCSASSPTRRSTAPWSTRACSSAAGTDLLSDQIVASGVTFAYSFVVTLIIANVIDRTMGLRVSEADEDAGLDLSQHAETAYAS